MTGAQPWPAQTAEMVRTPALVPISPPIAPVRTASETIMTAMCRGAAPTGRHRPISARRSLHDSDHRERLRCDEDHRCLADFGDAERRCLSVLPLPA